MKKTILALAMLASAVIATAQPQRRPQIPVESDYPGAHDPVVAQCDGKYYLFTTGYGVSIMTSSDMKTWKTAGSVFKTPPQWALDSVPGYNGHTWAPDIIQHDGTWYLYYSCSSFGKNSSAIGVVTNKTLNPESPDYKWVDHGPVVVSKPGQDYWNAIDANAVIDDKGQAWLDFGSFWGGIKLVKLDKSMTKVDPSQEMLSLCYRPKGSKPSFDEENPDLDPKQIVADTGTGAVEAPFIFKKDGWYYLFVSYDVCCRGAESTYKVVVGRSKDVTGPYVDKKGVSMMEGGGHVVVTGNAKYAGAGHSATVSFNGKDYLFFHAYDTEDAGRSHLIIREINWDKQGWPTVKL